MLKDKNLNNIPKRSAFPWNNKKKISQNVFLNGRTQRNSSMTNMKTINQNKNPKLVIWSFTRSKRSHGNKIVKWDYLCRGHG